MSGGHRPPIMNSRPRLMSRPGKTLHNSEAFKLPLPWWEGVGGRGNWNVN